MSFQVLKPGFRYWFCDDPDAGVAYVDTGRYWLAAGAPLCSTRNLARAAETFALAAREHGRTAAFFGAVERLVQASSGAYDWLQVGSQASWDPRRWPDTVEGTSVPSQVRRAARKGLRIREIPAAHLEKGTALRLQAARLIQGWRDRHGLPPMRYVVDLAPFTCRRERRYFAGFLEERMVALVVAVPIYARNGWFLESLLFDPPVPNGTAVALVDLAMRTLGAEGAEYATTGISALVGLPGGPQRHPGLTAVMRFCYERLNGLYSFQGIERFQDRLRPHGWEPVYLLAHRRVTPGTVWAVLKSFAGGRLDRFAWWTLRRRLGHASARAWAVPADALAGLLLPWIAVLLSVDGTRWFGTPWLPQAWAAFDALLAAAFFGLAHRLKTHRPARPLATVLLGAVLADAGLATAQAVLYNLPQGHPALLVAVACGAPMVAAAYLAGLLLLRRRR